LRSLQVNGPLGSKRIFEGENISLLWEVKKKKRVRLQRGGGTEGAHRVFSKGPPS